MAKQTILVVEDDEDIQQLVSYNLVKAGFDVECADSGEEGLRKINSANPDLVLLDLMLPGINGSELCRQLRSSEGHRELPVIMLTAKGEDVDVSAGLDLGADDYITKPFSPAILIARIKAVLRRRKSPPTGRDHVIEIHNLTIDPGRHQVTMAGRQLQLTLTEFGILELMARRPGWAFSRQQIIDAVRGYEYIVTPRAIDVQISTLRKKLGETGKRIETVRGIGYRLADR
ncbi:MAG: response regulator transcription factor [Desulfurivibrionaceae bacterium]